MTQQEIFHRCLREIKNSKNLAMLRVARRYSELFLKEYNQSLSQHVAINLIYDVTKRQLQ